MGYREPKTDAGHRTVILLAGVAAVLQEHLAKHVPPSPEVLLFSTSSGGYLARSNWNSTFRRAADAIGLPAVRPHELRHTGATLAAATGATTKELMRRLKLAMPVRSRHPFRVSSESHARPPSSIRVLTLLLCLTGADP